MYMSCVISWHISLPHQPLLTHLFASSASPDTSLCLISLSWHISLPHQPLLTHPFASSASPDTSLCLISLSWHISLPHQPLLTHLFASSASPDTSLCLISLSWHISLPHQPLLTHLFASSASSDTSLCLISLSWHISLSDIPTLSLPSFMLLLVRDSHYFIIKFSPIMVPCLSLCWYCGHRSRLSLYAHCQDICCPLPWTIFSHLLTIQALAALYFPPQI